MMGKPNQLEPKLFYHDISLDRRIPADHPLRKIKQLVDFDFIRSQVADTYGNNGNQSVDPSVILKLVFLLFYLLLPFCFYLKFSNSYKYKFVI